jgi:hypothetical protein
MKQFISQVKNLSQKAAEIKAAMQQVPPKVAEIREAVAATTGQLQQLKSEINYSVADLKADDEDRLSRALQELNNSREVFAEVGFVLSGVDFEISPVQRMLVRLTQTEVVQASVLRALLTANQPRRTIHAMLSAILQAKQMADTVEFDGLHYAELIVGIGPIPSVRICWRDADTFEGLPAARPTQTLPVMPTMTSPTPVAQSIFGPNSLFEKQPPLPAPVPTVAPHSPAVPPVSEKTVVTTPKPESASAGKSDPLARFRKMPDLTKHS